MKVFIETEDIQITNMRMSNILPIIRNVSNEHALLSMSATKLQYEGSVVHIDTGHINTKILQLNGRRFD